MRIRQSEPQPMGFNLSKAASEKPRMQLIAYIQSENSARFTAVQDSVDAVLVEVSKADDLESLDKVCQSKEKTIGGGWLKVSASGTVKKAFGAACDFMVFPPATAVNLIPKEKLGCILELDAALSEGLLRAISDMPVGAVLIFAKEVENTLTLNRLMQVQRVAYMVNKPVITGISAAYSEIEMQALWDAGVSAVVVELTDDKSLDKIADLVKIIDKLDVTVSRKKDRTRAILPRLQAEPEPPEEDEEEEEEEDE